MFVITPAEVAAIAQAYRASGSLEAAAAALRARFRVLTESQARRIAAQILGVPHDTEEEAPPAALRAPSVKRPHLPVPEHSVRLARKSD